MTNRDLEVLESGAEVTHRTTALAAADSRWWIAETGTPFPDPQVEQDANGARFVDEQMVGWRLMRHHAVDRGVDLDCIRGEPFEMPVTLLRAPAGPVLDGSPPLTVIGPRVSLACEYADRTLRAHFPVAEPVIHAKTGEPMLRVTTEEGRHSWMLYAAGMHRAPQMAGPMPEVAS